MEKDSSQETENNCWHQLPTVTTFDKGKNSLSRKYRQDSLQRTVSSTSMLINALINQLCAVLEKDPVQSEKLYFSLCDIMHKMKLIDHSYKLEKFEGIQGRYGNQLYHLITVIRATIGSKSPIPILRPLVTYVSPYQSQFTETGFIAAGGFGNVFKAIHKLDEVEYAIKKIIVRPGRIKSIMTHLEEVKTLAKLNHTNIVSYKQAWIEPISEFCMESSQVTDQEICSGSMVNKIVCKDSCSLNQSSSQSYENYKSSKYQDNSSESSSISFNSKFSKISESCDVNSDVVSFREDIEISDTSIESNLNTNNITEISSRSTSEESSSSNESIKDRRIHRYSSRSNQCAILYIQMALCEKTLRQWLDERVNPTSVSTVAMIATQILSGLNYIHSLNIVHHDIKPSNIFITMTGKLKVQLGDFGLACPLQRDSHDAIVGTCMYAAPEQLKGECNSKSDIYSLGIVLVELLIPMQTSMECIKTIQTLQAGEVPTSLATSHPKWIDIIRQLIKKNPSRRPSAEKFLEDLKIDKDLTISKLRDENFKLQNENMLLRNENKEKDKLIQKQKLEIEELLSKLANAKC